MVSSSDENYRIYQAINQLRLEMQALAVLQLGASLRITYGWTGEKAAAEALTMVNMTMDAVQKTQ